MLDRLLLAVFLAIQGDAETNLRPLCGPKGLPELLPASNCSQFFVCVAGNKTLVQCPKGMHFNKTTKRCDHPDKAGCLAAQTPATRCPVYRSVRLPHPECHKFYLCRYTMKLTIECPKGMHYNAASHTCDLPEVAKCSKAHMVEKVQEKCEENQEGKKFFNPLDCKSYWRCEKGFMKLHQCSLGEYFDITLRACDPYAKDFCS